MIDFTMWDNADNKDVVKLAELLNEANDDKLSRACCKYMDSFLLKAKVLMEIPEPHRPFFSTLLLTHYTDSIKLKYFPGAVESGLIEAIKSIYRKICNKIDKRGRGKGLVSTIEENYSHFAERLKDRYRIEITFDEYLKICRYSNFYHWYKINGARSVGEIVINNTSVIVIRQKSKPTKEAVLLTAYPDAGNYVLEKMPVPEITKNIISKRDFWKEVNEATARATELSKEFLNTTEREYFLSCKDKEGFEFKLYCAGSKIASNKFRIGYLIQCVANKIAEENKNKLLI